MWAAMWGQAPTTSGRTITGSDSTAMECGRRNTAATRSGRRRPILTLMHAPGSMNPAKAEISVLLIDSAMTKVALFLPLVLIVGERMPMSNGKTPPHPLYELYSWPNESGETWNFSLLPAGVSRPRAPEEIFDPARVINGLRELDRRLGEFPPGTGLYWIARLRTLERTSSGRPTTPTLVKGTERLKLPPEGIIQEVRALARKHRLRLDDLVVGEDAPAAKGEDNGESSRGQDAPGNLKRRPPQ